MRSLLTYEFPMGTRSLTSLRKKRTKHRESYTYNKLVRFSHFRQILRVFDCFAFKFEQHSYTATKSFLLGVTVKSPCLVFIFALKGDLELSDPFSQKITSVAEGKCFAVSLPAGRCSCPIKAGKSKVAVLVLNTKWMLDNGKVYEALRDILNDVTNGVASYHLLPVFDMNVKIDRHLKKLTEIKYRPSVTIEKVMLPIANRLALDYYELFTADNKRARSVDFKTPKQVAYEVRDRIISDVENGIIPDIGTIADDVAKSRSTLRRMCIKIFGMNTQRLILDAQMKVAHGLVRKGLKVQEVSNRLGFADYPIFSRKYKNYFGHSPEQDRRRQ